MYMGNLLELYFEGNGCKVNQNDLDKLPYKYIELINGPIGHYP